MFSKRCEHQYEIISYAYSKDYDHPNCFDEYGNQCYVSGSRNTLWGQDVTVFTLQCQKCGKLTDKQVDGRQKPPCVEPKTSNILSKLTPKDNS